MDARSAQHSFNRGDASAACECKKVGGHRNSAKFSARTLARNHPGAHPCDGPFRSDLRNNCLSGACGQRWKRLDNHTHVCRGALERPGKGKPQRDRREKDARDGRSVPSRRRQAEIVPSALVAHVSLFADGGSNRRRAFDDRRGVFTAYPFKVRASFESGDPTLQQMWQVGWRTARLCAHSTYMDCPYYERLQYAGDTRIQVLISLYMTGDDRLAKNAVELLDDSRVPEGITQSRYPSHLPQMIPPFSLFWIGMLHDLWWYRGDGAFVRQFLPGMRNVLGL